MNRYTDDMRILGIETSCDETSVAVVEDGTRVLKNVIASSRSAFAESGGVIPEDAARKQVEVILPVLHQAVDRELNAIDAIAVTKGPGLLGSLLVGTTMARVLASLWKKPLIGVHHTLGHLSSTWLSDHNPNPNSEPEFPILTLSASGGHTDLWYRTAHTKGSLIGQTRDDAAGEAFDKGASMLGLPYPGGPAISKTAEEGDPLAFAFPLPLQGDSTLNFSFSGLKTALKYTIRDLNKPIEKVLPNLAASYEHAICTHLVKRITEALERYPDIEEVHLVGGVSANTHLRALTHELCPDVTIRTPVEISYCTDNAAMIASAGFFLHSELGKGAFETFETEASLPLSEIFLS